MTKRSRNFTPAMQQMTFSRRVAVVGGLQMGIGTLLAVRMGYISIFENAKYELQSESNRVNLTLIPPRRGWFIDRKGKPIADNRTDFRVDIIPDRLPDKDKQRVVRTLAQLLALEEEDIARINKELKNARGFQPVQVASDLDWDRFAAVSVRLPDLPGVSPRQGFTRNYPSGAAVGHLVGYVGVVSAEEYAERKDPLLITPGFKVGKEGLEKTLEDRLQGVAGAKRVEVTAGGKIVRDLDSQPDTPGKPVKLTIDIDLHNYAARRLGRESGSVVIFDCLTGDILTLASMPCYDPNSFSSGIGAAEYQWLRESDRIPLLNKALQGLYPPGSTLKPMVAVALQQAGVDPKETVNCPGGYRLGNRTFRCLGRHGPVDMSRAIMVSCNTYFYAMGRRVGYDAIAPVARTFGLGQEFDLPFASQYYGTVPDSAWLMKKYQQKWTDSDTLNATIGQGYVLTSPFQLALMAARIASGLDISPHILAGKRKAPAALPFPADYLAVAREGMDRVVNDFGTGRGSRLDLDDVKMAGKTGTAQVRAISRSGARLSGRKYLDHGLFVCFAPVDKPRYGAAVVIEHGQGGARAAAPVAKDVLTFLYDPQQAMERLEALEASWGGTIAQRMAAGLAEFRRIKEGGPLPAAPADTGQAESETPA